MEGKLFLRYFNIRGKAELIRLVLEEAGDKYEEVRFSRDEWISTIKPQYVAQGISPFGQVPILSIGDSHLAQTVAICRLLAKKHGIYGSDLATQFRCDMIMDGVECDWRTAYVDVVYPDDPKSFPELKQKWLEKQLPSFLKQFETLLGQKEGGHAYFCGKEFTVCDLVVFEMLDLQLRLDANALASAPLLRAFHDRVANRPKIKEYLASGRRPVNANNSHLG